MPFTVPYRTVQDLQKPFAEFRLPVIFAGIIQAPFPLLAEAFAHPVDGGIVDAQDIGSPISRSTVEQVDNNQVANLETSITALPQLLAEPLLDGETDVWGQYTAWEFPPWGA
jgi:hypothetical protein